MPPSVLSRLQIRVQALSDRVVSPATRAQLLQNVQDFSRAQPFLATFLGLQLLLSLAPLLIFLSFSATVLLFSFGTALLVALFWIGAALLLFVPVLFVTVSSAVAVWVWAVSTVFVMRWTWGVVGGVRARFDGGAPNGMAPNGVVGKEKKTAMG